MMCLKNKKCDNENERPSKPTFICPWDTHISLAVSNKKLYSQTNIHLHLDLPTSSCPVPPLPPHTSPTRTLYHSKRSKDAQTKDAYTSALAKKVAKITPTFSRLTAQLHSSKISPQSFADTANAAITQILQHAAHVVLGKVDPPTP